MRNSSTGLKTLFLLAGNYIWRNRRELKSRLEQRGLLERLRNLRPPTEPDKDRPIEAQFRKIG